MKKICFLLLLISSAVLARTADQVYVMPHAGNIPGFGPVNLAAPNATVSTLPQSSGGVGYAVLPANSFYAGPASSATPTASPSPRLIVYNDLIATPAIHAPTRQIFTANASGATNYAFTITSASATAGWTFTNNGATFTVLTTISSSTTVFMSGTGTPAGSGTLTCATGCSSNITFSTYTGAYVLPTNPSPILIKVTMTGGGAGGGAHTNSTIGVGGVSGAGTLFGSQLNAEGGSAPVGGTPDWGGAGGICSLGSVTTAVCYPGSGGGSGGSNGSTASPGGAGGGSFIGGGGYAGNVNNNGGNAGTNSGGGGGGSGSSGSVGPAGGGGGGAATIIYWQSSPSAEYSYSIGAGGAGGSSTAAGGSGAAGQILVEEFYQ